MAGATAADCSCRLVGAGYGSVQCRRWWADRGRRLLVGGKAWDATWSANPVRVVGGLAGMGLFGTVLGALHWLVLRRRVARAGWWVLASGVGWVTGAPVGAVLGGGLSAALGWSGSGAIDWALTWAGVGAIYGAITGRVLVWLLRRPAAGTAAA